ncbi:adenosylcobinamide amidohydrolase [Rhizobium sp. FKL33]|uniref:adenosylcobinamide amidohydrolase n=1 Tax=Rhizobium sp. FKL33 TaxID=2562307 RepID=UPI0014856846|nr:adenosylcobinamide amidohydrolase [Rhizobium sp. FKL33]
MNAPVIHCADKILAARFEDEQAVLSWSLTRPGFTRAHSVAWLEVSDRDLPVGVDPADLLRTGLAARGYGAAVQMMTSRDVRKHHRAECRQGEATGFCLATVGLANAGRVGHDAPHDGAAGTINLLAHVDRSLDQAGMIEALSIAAQARTSAVIDLGWKKNGLVVTGTGTDCIALACPATGPRQTYAGLHTDIGRAIGAAVYQAVLAGGREWVAERIEDVEGNGR